MKVAFVHIPKTAGGSIKSWLFENYKFYNFDYNQKNQETHTFLKDIEKPYNFSFTCVRNTYDRMISSYEWNKYKIGRRVEKNKNSADKEDLKVVEALNKGINYYLPWICENKKYGYMMASQLIWIEGVDYILNTENLEKDFRIIQEKLNCYLPLPQTVHKLTYDPSRYYSKEFVKTVENLYQDEINFFNYVPNKKYYNLN